MNHGAHIAEAHTHIGIAVVGMDHRGIKYENKFKKLKVLVNQRA